MQRPQPPDARDYNAISPSAKSLLLLKGLTKIPFAKATAERISFPDQYNPDIDSKDLAFWKRVVHFENRYLSIDQLLSQLKITNILELSSGFSFRGLDTVANHQVHYIDTDLPDVVHTKKGLMAALEGSDVNRKGNLKTVALNALDEAGFNEVVNSFPAGPLVIINEGLLMYLNNYEKESLCKIISTVLKQRGGFWITGDIYIKSTLERFNEKADDSLKELIEQQQIENNMFESFAVAEDFFIKSGFVIDQEARVELSKISSLPYLVANATAAQLTEMQAYPKIQATWRLKVANDFL